jgi:hypothetical protein
MATNWPLSVEVDIAEPRVTTPRYVVAGEGSTWATDKSTSGVFVDAVTGTAMLAPLPTTAAWKTTHTGNYARYRLTDYNAFTTPGNWSEMTVKNAGDYYITSKGDFQRAVTNVLLPMNQPMYVSFFMSGTKDASQNLVFECGWNYGISTQTGLKVYGNGAIEVTRGGLVQEKYDSTKGDIRPGGMKLYSSSPANTYVSLLLIPCRRRELMVLTNYGTNFSHAFSDLALDVPYDQNTNAITPAGYFYWQVQTPNQVTVQVAKCRFATSGTVVGGKTSLRSVPPVGTTFSGWTAGADRIGPNGSTIGATTYVINENGTAYNPSAPQAEVRAAVALTGDGLATWGVYAINLFSAPEVDETAPDAVNITDYVSKCSISVDEEGKAELTLEANFIRLFHETTMPNILTTAYRPVVVSIQKGNTTMLDIFRGTLDTPDIQHVDGDENGGLTKLIFKGRDRSLGLELTTLLDSVPYDGSDLDDAIADLLTIAGYTASDYYINVDPFVLPYNPSVSTGQWSLAPERGDTVAKWLNQLYDDYAKTHYRGWWPSLSGYRYNFVQPSVFSNTPVLKLYDSTSGALSAVPPVPATLLSARTIRSFSRKYESPEANNIQVLGYDARLDKPFFANRNNVTSQDPTIIPSLRDREWLGRIVTVIHTNASATTQAAVDRCADVLEDRLFPGRDLAEWECDFLIDNSNDRPLWIGDVVRINFSAVYFAYEYESNYADYRIIAIPSIDFIFEPTTGKSVRKAKYRGERIGPTPAGPGGGG